MLIAYPIEIRWVRPTAAGGVACDKDHPMAIQKRQRHPFAHAYADRTKPALCGFDEADDFEPLELSEGEDDGPIDWHRLICGDCLKELDALDGEIERETCENLPVIEGVRR